jgi:nitrogen fixation NifU-like protein
MGCAISQASMSMLGEELEGKTIAELAELGQRTMYELLGVPIGPRRFKCALLSLHTLKNALRKANHEKPQGWIDTVGPSENKVVV